MTPDQKRDAWVRFAAEVAAVGVSLDGGLSLELSTNATLARHCGAIADALLSEVEQREREGRFGSVDLSNPEGVAAEFRDLTVNRDEWMERAQRAEADKIGLIKARHEDAAHLSEVCARKDRTESLLKEALGALRRSVPMLQRLDLPGEAMSDPWGPPADLIRSCRDVIARARQEGFSDD